ncbi:hypothetical protein TSUD_242190 [Trifolium subterraneum]|uniref:Uncharacterized protein n=1 Tax=Trifolium subterraneum TaxID=3900 RepID=A0A2Z6MF56_TRISU|nr:hypothetical protein TSUD_242190 [Trifolium subterraneum]
MCNTRRDPNKGKEKVNEELVVNFKTREIQNNENKRKAIVLVEPDVKTKNSKSSNHGDVGTVSPQITVVEIDYGSISNRATDGDDVNHENKETREEEESKIDLTLMI